VRPACLMRGVSVSLLTALGVLAASASAFAASQTFAPTGGAEQQFTVPEGVTQVEVTAVGGAGQPGTECEPEGAGAGGAGAKVTAHLPVSAGETLYVDFGEGAIGGQPKAEPESETETTCPIGTAGSGGGASDVRTAAGSLASRLIVAGGGGGGGDGFGQEEESTEAFIATGGAGGSAGLTAGSGSPGSSNDASLSPPGGGEGGGQSAGGEGGAGGTELGPADGLGGSGILGQGGAGSSPAIGFGGGGGGGGGYYGGGGGGSGFAAGGGGGAGSSFISPSASGGGVTAGSGDEQEVMFSFTATTTGPTGETGTTGPTGPTGSTGETGTTGETAPVPTGSTGETVTTGETGTTGVISKSSPTGGSTEGNGQGTGSSGGTAGGGVLGFTNATASSAQIANLLGRELAPAGKAAKIHALLKAGGLTVTFKALEAGTAAIKWYQVPPGAKLAAKAKPVLVASGEARFSSAGTGKIKVKLTGSGKRLLRSANRLKLTAIGIFSPNGAPAVTVTKGLVLTP